MPAEEPKIETSEVKDEPATEKENVPPPQKEEAEPKQPTSSG